MELQNLKYFLTIASEGSFNKAANVLFLSQPSLSKAIANLEKELNVKLFKRNKRGVELTEKGKKLKEYAKILVAQIELIEGLSSHETPVALNIVSFPLPIISTIVARAYEKYIDQSVTVHYHVGRLGRVIEMVRDGKCDVGIITSNPTQSQKLQITLKKSNLEAVSLGTDTWYVVVGPKSPLYKKDIVSMKELLEWPVVRFRDDYFSNLTYFLEIDGIKMIEIKKEVFIDDNLDLQNFLMETKAFSFQLGINRSYFESRGLHVLPIANNTLQEEVLWIKQKKTTLPDTMKDLVAELQQIYGV